MNKPHPLLFQLQKMVVDLTKIKRHHYLAGTDHNENDIEHSFMIALLCWFIHDRHDIQLDIAKILKYALAHDFVELYAGDVNTFATSEERAQKAENEKLALSKMSNEYSEFMNMVDVMNAYENKSDDEALFVWTVDKMQALVMGDLDHWRPYNELHISYDSFVKKYSQTLEEASPYCKEIFEGLLEHCKSTYYDRPNE